MRLLSPSSRDYTDAREKVDAAGCCRVCGDTGDLQAAHIVPRSLAPTGGEDPRNIVPLCGPRHSPSCHVRYDAGHLDLEPFLTADEQAYAVTLTGSLTGALRVIRGTREVAA